MWPVTGERGLTLLEVIIALGILGIIGTAFLVTLATGNRATGALDQQTEAEALARTQLELMADVGPCSGAYPTVATPFQFTVSATSTYEDAPTNKLEKIVVTVSREGRPILSLTTMQKLPTDQMLYLHNNPSPPTADTTASQGLPLDTIGPTATTLYNYDTDRDGDVGRLLQKGGVGAGESDSTKYVSWQSGVLPDGKCFLGDVTVDLWSAMKDFNDVSGDLTVYLRDYNGSAYTEIGNATLSDATWQDGSTSWVEKTLTVAGLDYAIVAGNELEVKLILDVGAGDDMWLAYDTTTYASTITVP